MATSKTIHHFVVTAVQKDDGEWQFDVDNDTLDMFFHEGFYYDLEKNEWFRRPNKTDESNDIMLSKMLHKMLGS
ncbi:MAG: hypothetical protein EBT80_00575 [Chitinophagales bacterium]|nr:hypothetical protein [Chitinophagales bacterium]